MKTAVRRGQTILESDRRRRLEFRGPAEGGGTPALPPGQWLETQPGEHAAQTIMTKLTSLRGPEGVGKSEMIHQVGMAGGRPLKRRAVVILAMVAVLLGSGVPSVAARGGGHGGGGHGGGHSGGGRFGGGHVGGGRFHPGFHRGGCCWWWPGAVVGGVALGALAYPYYAYPYYPDYTYYPNYSDPDQVYVPPTAVEQAPMASQPPPVQREVVYPNGKYVLYGDGVTQPWQWVWVPAVPPPPPPPSQQ